MTDDKELRDKVARIIAYEFDVDADVFIGMHGRDKWEKQWHAIANAVLETPEIREALSLKEREQLEAHEVRGKELIERLRSKLPICPFSDNAPPHNLKPEDPCPVCQGLGTPDATDKCLGADTSVMTEAATFIEQLLNQKERLTKALSAARELIMQVNHETGYCMCGSQVESHGFGDGHSPVDEGTYAMQQVVDRIDAALTGDVKEEPSGS